MYFRRKLRNIAWIVTMALQAAAEIIGYWLCIMLVYFIVDDLHPLTIFVRIVSVLVSFALFVGIRALRCWLE